MLAVNGIVVAVVSRLSVQKHLELMSDCDRKGAL